MWVSELTPLRKPRGGKGEEMLTLTAGTRRPRALNHLREDPGLSSSTPPWQPRVTLMLAEQAELRMTEQGVERVSKETKTETKREEERETMRPTCGPDCAAQLYRFMTAWREQSDSGVLVVLGTPSGEVGLRQGLTSDEVNSVSGNMLTV